MEQRVEFFTSAFSRTAEILLKRNYITILICLTRYWTEMATSGHRSDTQNAEILRPVVPHSNFPSQFSKDMKIRKEFLNFGNRMRAFSPLFFGKLIDLVLSDSRCISKGVVYCPWYSWNWFITESIGNTLSRQSVKLSDDYVTLFGNIILNFVHRPEFICITTFLKLVLVPSSMNKMRYSENMTWRYSCTGWVLVCALDNWRRK
jgi:hypothetical protein